MGWGPKRRRRILLVAAAALLVVAGLAGARAWRTWRLEEEALSGRQSGHEAYRRGDFPAAADGLRRYLRRFRDRGAVAEDFLTFARARRRVESPRGAHLLEAIGALRTCEAVAPGDEDVTRELIDLYIVTQHATEALDLLDRILGSRPDDVGLNVLRRDVLMALGRHAEALEAARTVNRLAPGDLAGHLRTLAALQALDRPKGEVTAWIDGLLAEHPGDRRFEILRAAALRRADDPAGASAALDSILAAGDALPADPEFTLLLAGELDAAQRFATATEVLERRSGSADARIRRELARRLWCAGRRGDLAALVESWERTGLGDDPELLALSVVADAGGTPADVRDRRRRQLSGSDDPRFRAWRAFVDAVSPAPGASTPPAERLRELRAAVAAVPASALLHHALGEACAAAGEPDLAIAAWRDAAAHAPSWATPLRRIAEACLASGRAPLAAVLARSAVQRNPKDVASVTTYLRALSDPGAASGDALGPILAAVEKIRSGDPDLEEAVLPLEIDVLFRTDVTSAEKRLRDFIASGRRTKEETLLQVARHAGRHGSPLEEDLLDLCEAAHGVTPRLGLARADAARRRSGGDAGLAALEDARRAGAASAPAVDWDIARAVYLEASGNARAGEAWRALSETHEGDLRAQLGALASPSMWRDREVIARVIDRVRRLGGDQGVTWRLAHARLVLGSAASTRAEISEVGQMMSEVVRDAPTSAGARVLFARALRALGNSRGAEEQYRFAAGLAPEDTSITLEIAQMAQAEGRTDLARAQLERAIASPDLPPEQRERAAFLLALDGQYRRGIQVLEPLVSEAPGSRRAAVLLLARMYLRLGEPDRAAALAEPLLAAPDADVIEFCARVHAAAGRHERAREVLERLPSLNLEPGERELVLARVAGSSDPAAAADWYARAVAAAPARADIWGAYLRHLVVSGDAARLRTVLDRVPPEGDATAAFLAARRQQCIDGLSDDRVRILLVACIDDPADRELLWSAAARALEMRGPREKVVEASRELARMADSHPDEIALQVVAADALAVAGNLRGGIEIALRTMSRLPTSPLAANLAARLLARAGRWSEALEAARNWRDQAPTPEPAAENLVAELLLRTSRFAEAVAELGPAAMRSVDRPGERLPLVGAYAVALFRAGDAAAGRECLGRAAAAGPEVRVALLGVDSERLGDGATAMSWIACLAPADAGPSPEESIAAARALVAAWDRFRTPELLVAASESVARASAAHPRDARVHAAAGTLEQQRGRLEAARAEYEAALALDADLVLARNNLAMVLADLGLAREAVDQATRAVAAVPGSAELQDTLAHAHRAAGDFDRAEACLREAIRLEPANAAWPVALAETLLRSGKKDQIGLVLASVEEIVSQSGALPEPLRVRVAAVRSQIR